MSAKFKSKRIKGVVIFRVNEGGLEMQTFEERMIELKSAKPKTWKESM